MRLPIHILLITDGNTFALLDKLKRTGLDRAIKNFVKKDNFVLSGFSAGALVLTPNIKVCNLDKYDANKVGIEDYAAIGIVDFEVFPVFDAEYFCHFSRKALYLIGLVHKIGRAHV